MTPVINIAPKHNALRVFDDVVRAIFRKSFLLKCKPLGIFLDMAIGSIQYQLSNQIRFDSRLRIGIYSLYG